MNLSSFFLEVHSNMNLSFLLLKCILLEIHSNMNSLFSLEIHFNMNLSFSLEVYFNINLSSFLLEVHSNMNLSFFLLKHIPLVIHSNVYFSFSSRSLKREFNENIKS